MTLDELRTQAVASPTEVAPVLGMSARSVHRAMDRGELPEVWLGRRRLVPMPALLRLLGAEHEDAPGGGRGRDLADVGDDGGGHGRA